MKVEIDRLVLDIPGLDREGGEQLATRLGELLAAGDWTGDPVSQAYAAVDLRAGCGPLDPDALAAQAAAQLLRQGG